MGSYSCAVFAYQRSAHARREEKTLAPTLRGRETDCSYGPAGRVIEELAAPQKEAPGDGEVPRGQSAYLRTVLLLQSL